MKLRTQKDIKLHVEEVRKRGDKIKIKSKNVSSSDFDTSKKEILEELKSASYHDLEDLVYRMELTYDEFRNILDIKNFPSETTGCNLKPRSYEISDVNKTLDISIPDIVKLIITIGDITLKSNSNINQTLIFNKKSIFY